MKRLRQNLGELTMALGVAHILWGVREYRHVLREIPQDGLWMSISGHNRAERAECFWFMLGGVSTIMEGVLIRSMQQKGLRIPRAYGLINLGVMATIGATVPGSGAPEALVLSGLMLSGGLPKNA